MPERLQFFGSTVERFYDNKKPITSIGPGTYALAHSAASESKKLRNTNQAPFHSSNLRFNEKNSLAVPGPGSYQDTTIIENMQKKPWGK